jgi:hypothetical protein
MDGSCNTAGPPSRSKKWLRDVLDNNIQSVTTRKGSTMLRAILTAAALLCASHAAFAQELTATQRDACMGDYEKYCKSVAPGGGRIIACLAKESDKLAPGCKKVLEAAEKK